MIPLALGVGIPAAVERRRFASQCFAYEMKDDVPKLVASAFFYFF